MISGLKRSYLCVISLKEKNRTLLCTFNKFQVRVEVTYSSKRLISILADLSLYTKDVLSEMLDSFLRPIYPHSVIYTREVVNKHFNRTQMSPSTIVVRPRLRNYFCRIVWVCLRWARSIYFLSDKVNIE